MEFSKSKKVMKKFRIVSLILVLVLAASLFAGCKKDKNGAGKGSGEITWVVVGTEAADNEDVFVQFNSMLKEKTGYTVDFQYIDKTQYDLKFAAGDSFDLILAPDHMGYWENVRKGAFMELKEEDFKEYAPYIWENGQEMLNAAMYDGKYYAIPGINKYSPNRVLVARGDLMDKVGIDSLNTIDDIDAFLMGVADLNKKGETNIVPYNSNGGVPWMIFSMWASDWGWAAPGTLSFGGHYYYSILDDSRKLFIAIDKPEVLDYSNTVKKWYDNGVFSKSVLSNNTTAEEAYRNGKSAFAWTSSPASANIIFNDLKQIPGSDKWDTRFYSMYSKLQKVYGFMNSAVAVGATSDQKEDSLKVLNAIYSDEALYKLLIHGVEGKHYEVNENGEFTRISENYSAPSLGIVNQAYQFPTKYDYSYALDLVEEMDSIAIYEPLVNLPSVTDEDMAATAVKLNDIFTEYSTPRMYGAVDNVKAALDKERKALEVAGIDKYIKRVQKHMDDYIASHPEANEDFKKTRKAVLDYKKKNPNKVNPKDYK